MNKKLLSYKVAFYAVAILGVGSIALAYYGYPPNQPMNEPSPPEAAVVEEPTEVLTIAAEEVMAPPEESLGVAVLSGEAIDLVGTRSGTSTPVGVTWGGKFNATTTYPLLIDSWADNVVFTISPTAASSTPSGIARFNILASNDRGCDTATTTTTMANTIITGNIKWYDAAPFILNLAGSTSAVNNGTTTLEYTFTGPNQNKLIALDNLNTKCLALDVNASSTALHIQAKSKSYAKQ